MRVRNVFIIAAAIAMALGGASMAFGMGRPDSAPSYISVPGDTTGVSGAVPAQTSATELSPPTRFFPNGRLVSGVMYNDVSGSATSVSGDASAPASSNYRGRNQPQE